MENKEKLKELSLDYIKNHLGSDNQEQNKALYDIRLIQSIIEILG